MSEPEPDTPRPFPMVRSFPQPGRELAQAYRELEIARNGDTEQRKALGNPARLPRPWDPASVTQPQMRRELWTWLEEVVTWLNIEYTWDVATVIPECWPRHPHIVHEVAVIADLRRRAGLALSADALEEWHRYALPAFTERMRTRAKHGCDTGHQEWPARSRFNRHVSARARDDRTDAYWRDEAILRRRAEPEPDPTTRLRVVDPAIQPNVDPDTGEVFD